MVTAMVRGVSILAIPVLVSLVYLYFHPLLALWLIVLAVLTSFRPVLGITILFIVVSFDTGSPTLSGVVIDYSEFQFATVVCSWISRLTDLRRLDWRPLIWGAPFLVAVAISGLVNIPWYKVPFHVARLSELVVAMFLVKNVLELNGRGEGIRGSAGRSAIFDERKLKADLFKAAIIASSLIFPLVGFFRFSNPETARVFSTFGNPNQFAGFLIALLPFHLVFFLRSGERWRKAGWLYLAGILTITLIATQSRAAFVAIAVALLAICLLFYGRQILFVLVIPFGRILSSIRKSAVVLVGAIVPLLLTLLLLFWASSFPERLERSIGFLSFRSEQYPIAALQKYRLPYYKVGYEIWKRHPVFGVGPGRYRNVIGGAERISSLSSGEGGSERRYLRVHVHNLYLQLAISYGILGLLAFMWILRAVFTELARLRSESVWALAGIGLLIAFCLHNLFDVTFPSLALEIGILLGAALHKLQAGGRNGCAV